MTEHLPTGSSDVITGHRFDMCVPFPHNAPANRRSTISYHLARAQAGIRDGKGHAKPKSREGDNRGHTAMGQ